MAIGIVSDEEFENELASYESKKKRRVREDTPEEPAVIADIPKESHGRNEGDVNIPDSLRQIIGEDAVINGRQSALQIARDFGISASSVSAYAKGATSTTSYNSPSPSIFSHITKSKVRAVKRASKTLNGALSAISQEKLDYTDAKDLSGIAKDMSVIIKNLEPQSVNLPENGNNSSPQFVIFAPQFKSENSFEVIDVKE